MKNKDLSMGARAGSNAVEMSPGVGHLFQMLADVSVFMLSEVRTGWLHTLSRVSLAFLCIGLVLLFRGKETELLFLLG